MLRLLERSDVCRYFLELVLCKLKDPLARSATPITCFQNLRQFREGESNPQRVLNHPDSLNGACRIESVARSCPRCAWEDTHSLIVSKRIWTKPYCLG